MLKPLMNKPKEKSYVIFSPLEGVLKEGGNPLANVKISRELSWNANEKGVIEHFHTDENGYFKIPLREESFSMSNLNQFSASQYLYINHDEQTHDLWSCGKLSEGLYGETGAKLEALVCDISEDYAKVKNNERGILATKCRWKGIELETYDE